MKFQIFLRIQIRLKISIFILFLLILFAGPPVSAEDSKFFDKISTAVQKSLPKGWAIFSIESNVLPRWSFSKDKCWLIKVYGPEMAGRKYFKKFGEELLGEKKIFNESIYIWVGNENFNPKLSFLNRIINRLNISPERLPKEICKVKGYSVYAMEDHVTLPIHEEIARDGIKGWKYSEYLDFDIGRSWPTWQNDLKNALGDL